MKLTDTQSPEVDLLILAGWGDWPYKKIPRDVLKQAAKGILPRVPTEPAPEIPDPLPELRRIAIQKARGARGCKRERLEAHAARMRDRREAGCVRAKAEGAKRRWAVLNKRQRGAAMEAVRSYQNRST